MARLFGTDGIRGVAGRDLTAEFAFHLGEAVGELIREQKWDERILVGRDSRISGPMLECGFASGVMSTGCDIYSVGVAPTPVVAYLTRHLEFPLGCVISASHNPIEDNGIKFFDRRGMKVEDEIEGWIEGLLKPGAYKKREITGEGIGRRWDEARSVDEYVRFLSSIGQDRVAGLSAVIDAAFGAASMLAPAVFQILGVRVTPLNCTADGSRINVNCGATNVEQCREKVLATNADLGIALDGDADRAILIDENGNTVDGDQILAMWALHLLQKNALSSDSVVGTVLSNKGLEVAIEEAGGKLLRAPVGDRHVLHQMISSGATIGGEQSGHVIFLEHHTTGDGILTALMVGMLMREKNKRLSELGRLMTRYPQVQLNIRVRDKKTALEDSDVMSKVETLSREISKVRGRMLVRPSGTEPVIRVMTEAPDETVARKIAEMGIALFKPFSENGIITEL